MRFHPMPDGTRQRVPSYLRDVFQLSAQGVQNISSGLLSERIGVRPWQSLDKRGV